MTESRPMSIVITPGPGGDRADATAATATTTTRTETRLTGASTPHWKLVVTHASGSLEAAVSSQRRRNLFISSSVLGLLGASMGLLVLATRRAQRLARQQMEFVAAVSHELRTPLAVIRSAAENLADGVVHDAAKIKSYGELMRTEGRRLTDMVEQILEFAGIQSGQRGFALRPVGIGPLLHDIVSASSELIAGASMVVEFDVPADLPAVLGDEPALRRAFQNLIDNAIKYGSAGGSIRVSARISGSHVNITVADRGIGIEAAAQARIFEPFYRAADVVAAQLQGAGLGLSLVQRIVVAHGGRVTVKSVPREGSAFTVQLPAAGDRAAADRAPAAQAEHSSSPPSASSSADAAGVQALRSS
jgi:signal transduction histidine kinase